MLTETAASTSVSWAYMQAQLTEWDESWRRRHGSTPSDTETPTSLNEAFYKFRCRLLEQMLTAYAKRKDAKAKAREQKIKDLEMELTDVLVRLQDAEDTLAEFREALQAEGSLNHAPLDLTEASAVAREDRWWRLLHRRYAQERELWLGERDEAAVLAKRAQTMLVDGMRKRGPTQTTAVQTVVIGEEGLWEIQDGKMRNDAVAPDGPPSPDHTLKAITAPRTSVERAHKLLKLFVPEDSPPLSGASLSLS